MYLQLSLILKRLWKLSPKEKEFFCERVGVITSIGMICNKHDSPAMLHVAEKLLI